MNNDQQIQEKTSYDKILRRRRRFPEILVISILLIGIMVALEITEIQALNSPTTNFTVWNLSGFKSIFPNDLNYNVWIGNGYDDNVPLGNRLRVMGDANLSSELFLKNATPVSIWLYNQSSASNSYNYNESTWLIGEYGKFWYNMTTTSVTNESGSYSPIKWAYNQSLASFNQYGQFWYNMTTSSVTNETGTYLQLNASTYSFLINESGSYAGVKWNYNQSDGNTNYTIDLTAAYGKWWFNQTTPANTYADSLLVTTYYNATQAAAITGTVAGTLNYTQHPLADYDGVTFNITEQAPAPALDLRVNFTGITSFNEGVMRYYTSSLVGSYPVIQLWNYETLAWEDYPSIGESTSYAIVTQKVYDDDEHLQDGVVQMRIYKSTTGNTNNKYYVDWLAISSGPAVPSGQETDPYSVHRDGSTTLNANWNTGGYNITVQSILGDGTYLTNVVLANSTYYSLFVNESGSYAGVKWNYNQTTAVHNFSIDTIAAYEYRWVNESSSYSPVKWNYNQTTTLYNYSADTIATYSKFWINESGSYSPVKWNYNQTTSVNDMYGKWFYNMSLSPATLTWNKSGNNLFPADLADHITIDSYLSADRVNTTTDAYLYGNTCFGECRTAGDFLQNEKIQVMQNNDGSSYITLTDTANNRILDIARQTGSNSINFTTYNSANDINIYGGLNIEDNVGVGTTTPQNALHIQRDVSNNYVALVENIQASSSLAHGLLINSTGAGDGSILLNIQQGNNINMLTVTGANINTSANIIMDKSASFIKMGNTAGGPHGITFNDVSYSDGVQLVYRTSPNQLIVEDTSGGTDGTDIFYLDKDDYFAYFAGNVGVGTTTPLSTAKFSSIGNNYQFIGADSVSVNTNKVARIGTMNYASDNEVTTWTTFNTNTVNQLKFGGGTTLGDVATTIDLYTARTTVNNTGAKALTINETQSVQIHRLQGSGNAYACIDANGYLFRSATACV